MQASKDKPFSGKAALKKLMLDLDCMHPRISLHAAVTLSLGTLQAAEAYQLLLLMELRSPIIDV